MRQADGAVAQSGERLTGSQKVEGSNPSSSTCTFRTLQIAWQMDKQNKQQTAELKYLLEELRKQLLEASMHFEIWEGLWPTTQVVDVINRYKGFFLPTRNAHIDRFYIKACNVVSNKSSQPSFYRVFSMLNKNANLVPGLDVRSLKKRLKNHKKTLSAI